MNNDPRRRNETFDCSSIGTFLTGYARNLQAALDSVDISALEHALRLIERAGATGQRIFAIGNGGSAAIAEHLSCDWTKGTHCRNHRTIDTQSLSSNTALYSAIANDYGFEQVFATQIGLLGRQGDVLVAISSSGESANILAAVHAARERGMTTIGLSGFSGGQLRDAADVAIHVVANNYGIVEDAHQSLMHVLSQFVVVGRELEQRVDTVETTT